MTLILKIGPTHCPPDHFHPKNENVWEGQSFTAPIPKTLRGDLVDINQLPISTPVFIWTHHHERIKEQPGQGLTASGYIASIELLSTDLMKVKLDQVKLISPTIRREEMEALASDSDAIQHLLQHTTTRSISITNEDEEHFLNAIAAFQETKAMAIAEAEAKYNPAMKEPDTALTQNTGWSADETTACLLAYVDMLGKEQSGEQYNKAEVNRKLRETILASRSRGALEFRMQNISSFFKSKGLPVISGYKPRDHIGPKVTDQLEAAFSSLKSKDILDYCSTEDLNLLQTRAENLRGSFGINKPIGNQTPRKVGSTTSSYVRSTQVVAYVLERANGICELCEEPAPFLNTSGIPFLEVHHVRPLSEQGPDIVENAAALCPNCHRACHSSNNKENLRKSIIENVEMLASY